MQGGRAPVASEARSTASHAKRQIAAVSSPGQTKRALSAASSTCLAATLALHLSTDLVAILLRARNLKSIAILNLPRWRRCWLA